MIVKAYAKVNLGLAVTNRRADGFHNIDTIFALIDLFDVIRLEPNQAKIQLKVSGADLPTDSTNLAYKAAKYYLRSANENRGVFIHLTKNIPISAGLGGGSSNAAAILLALAKIYPSSIDLDKIALDLGSDVPFFLSSFKAARGRGQGEVLEEIQLARQNLLLVNPNIEVRAKDAYGNLNILDKGLEINQIVKQLNIYEKPNYINSLQNPVISSEPKIAELLKTLAKFTYGVLMSGSGSTCFGLAKTAEEIDLARAELKKIYPEYWLRAAQTL